MKLNGVSSRILFGGLSLGNTGDVQPSVVPNATELKFAVEIKINLYKKNVLVFAMCLGSGREFFFLFINRLWSYGNNVESNSIA